MKHLTSVQNPQVKQWLQLQEKAKARKQSGVFIIEGLREISLALSGGYTLQCVAFCPDMLTESELRRSGITADEWVSLSREVYAKVAYRESTEGVLAIARAQSHHLADLQLGKAPLILVAEGIEKPGNVGALLRTADAAALDAVILANPKTDLYNPNLIRSSVGCVFTNRIATASTDETIAFLKQQHIRIFSAILQEAEPYHHQDFTGPTALVVGTEDSGLSAPWREHSYCNIIIPMQGKIDSMNVSVAAAISLFEAKRQRNFL